MKEYTCVNWKNWWMLPRSVLVDAASKHGLDKTGKRRQLIVGLLEKGIQIDLIVRVKEPGE